MFVTSKDNSSRKRINLLPFALNLVAVIVAGLLLTGLLYPQFTVSSKASRFTVEPAAGTWKTWVLTSGSQFRAAQPPNSIITKKEMATLKALAKQRNAENLERIAYWTAGPPSYRWNRIAVDTLADTNTNTLVANRYLSILDTALADAMIAAWDSKYTYLRPRPADYDQRFSTAVPTPYSPSYPSEHAVAAGAASEVLGYLFPDQAEYFAAKAEEEMKAVLIAGLQYPSDVQAGFEMGKKVAQVAIERAKTDGSDQTWDGVIPSEPGKWTGTNPALPTMGKWKTWVLTSGDQFRPAPPPTYDSPELAAEMEALRTLQRTPKMTVHGFFWEFGAGGARNYWFWNNHLDRKILETSLASNPPRAARAQALMNTAVYDSNVACWDAKYTYWAVRPFQLDPNFKPLFTTPNHPSYPSAHSCLSAAAADTLSYLFPGDAAEFQAHATEAGEARIWAGIHFASDVEAGNGIGHNVAAAVIEYANQDGSSK